MSNGEAPDEGERPVAIVTGALQGLGLGAARHLISEGFNVAVIDLADTPKMAAERDIGEEHCRYYQMDISAVERHDAVLSAIESDFGRLDCLVNNAGIAARPLTDILELGVSAFDRSVDVNLRGTFFLTQRFARRLIADGASAREAYRSIIFITSIAAEMVSTDRSQYCVTKSALSMVAKLFAARLGSAGIHVHEVRPGFMQTAMTASGSSGRIEELLGDGFVPLPRWGQPEDVGRAVASLAAGHLPYMTGQPVWIAGGLNIAPNL